MASVGLAFAVSLIWGALGVRLGSRWGFVDQPGVDELKTHERPAVPLGGVGVFLGVHAAALLRSDWDWYLFAATSALVLLGLIEDRIGLSLRTRLAVELPAAIVIVVGASSAGSGLIQAILGVLLVVLAINAVNLLDGLDGLAGSAGLVSAVGLAFMATARDMSGAGAAALAATLLAFLIFNWHPARLFLGDSGAYVTGALLAHHAIEVSPSNPLRLVVAGSLLGVFAVDLIVTVIRRSRAGRPLFAGDRSHVYDQMRDRGLSIRRVAVLVALGQAALVAMIVLVDELSAAPVATVGVVVAFVASVVGLAIGGFLGARSPEPG